MDDDTEPTLPIEPLTGPVSGTGAEPTRLLPAHPPVSQQPAYRQPVNQQPAYQQPVHQQPAYQQPVYPQPVYQPATYGYASTMIARPTVGGVHIAIAWVFAILSVGYFLPWAVAATRQRSNTLAIGLLNFFVGWTIIGWIVSLVMACASESVHVSNVSVAVMQPPQSVQQATQALPAAGWYPQGPGQRYWDGQRWTEHTAP